MDEYEIDIQFTYLIQKISPDKPELSTSVVELSNDESMENRKVVELSNDEPMENTKVSWVDIVKKGENHK